MAEIGSRIQSDTYCTYNINFLHSKAQIIWVGGEWMGGGYLLNKAGV